MKRKYQINILGTLLICVVTFSYILFRAGAEEKYVPLATHMEILAMDFVNNYPQNPHSLITENNKIIQSLYGGAIEPESIEAVLIQQRILFSDEILEKNSLGSQLENTIREIVLLEDNGQFITSIDIESVMYDIDDRKIATVTTNQNTTTGHTIHTEYWLALRAERWKILGWQNTVTGVQ